MTALAPERYRLLTFDCYGTLIDWESGISSALEAVCNRHGVDTDHEDRLAHFGAVEHQVQTGPFQPYRAVLAATLAGIGERLGFVPSTAECDAFAASVADWPPFPDTVSALSRLAERYSLAIVSNVDDDLFAGSAAQLGVPFEWVVTAEQVGSYKPSRGHFDEVLNRSGIPKDDVLHVAQSLFHDVAPASALGFTTLWVNRRGNKPGSGATPAADARPDAEVASLAEAASLLLDA